MVEVHRPTIIQNDRTIKQTKNLNKLTELSTRNIYSSKKFTEKIIGLLVF